MDGPKHVQGTLSDRRKLYNPCWVTLSAHAMLLPRAQAAHADADRIDADGLPHVQNTFS